MRHQMRYLYTIARQSGYMADHNPLTSFSWIIALLLFSLFLLNGMAAGASVSFDQPAVCVHPGMETPVNLILDTAPAGISGYSIMISVDNPDIGEISAVKLPEWAEISDITGVPGSDAMILAVDLQGKVEKGATGIVLATISLKGIAPGTTDVILSDPEFDDAADGNPMTPSIVNATFTVSETCITVPETTTPVSNITSLTATPIPYGGSGGGGSGSGSSSVSAAAVTTASRTPGPETSPTREQTTDQTGETTPAMTTPSLSSIPAGETTSPSPTGQGIPVLSAPGIMVLVGALLLLGRKMR
jgi:hypothetical protein